jgi:hypothetical protein
MAHSHSRTGRAAALSGLLLWASSAGAVPVEYDIAGQVDFGSLLGERYSGRFSFDAAGLTGLGAETLAAGSASFTFLARTFTLADAAHAATVDFQDGMLLGLNFEVTGFDPGFSLIAGTSFAPDPFLAYSPSAGVDGTGFLAYAQVPEPGSLGLLAWALPALRGRSARRG